MNGLPAPATRISSIDFVRGILMIIMALDHTRDFFHDAALVSRPLDPATTYPALYFTRWVTHFCAPGFVFLSGVSAWLQQQRKPKKTLQWFLISRGLWLIVFDLTVLTLILTADIHFGVLLLETLSAIGAGMLLLGLLIHLPYRLILIIGLIIFFGHNILDFFERSSMGGLPAVWKLLHQPGFIPLVPGHGIMVLYPFLSWCGLTLLGYACGKLFTAYEPPQRKKILVVIGTMLLVLFVLLRFINLYGDPQPWTPQSSAARNFYAFMNLQKYPPSLLFLCATIGPLLILLGLVKSVQARWQQVVTVFGRVPLFYFALHLLVLHAVQIAVYLSKHSLQEGMQGGAGALVKFTSPGEGVSLMGVYLIWLLLLVVVYPLCKWYDAYKTRRRHQWWLSYL